MKELFATVYDKTLSEVGWIDGCSSLLRTYRYRNPGSFVMRIPASPADVALMLTGFIIVFSDEPTVGYLIESVEPAAEFPNVMEVSGRDLRALFGFRIVPRCQTVTGTLWNRVYWLIDYNFINPKQNPDLRKIGFIQELPKVVESYRGPQNTRQFTGDNVLDAIVDMLGTEKYGWKCELNIDEKTITPKFLHGGDKTSTVLFDDILGSLDNCEYIRDVTNYCTVATIGGEAKEDGSRVFTGIDISGGASGTYAGFDRRELFVDARDLQSTFTDENGTVTKVKDYEAVLQQRGWEKLLEKKIKTKITIEPNESIYQFGKDYELGDVVSFCSHGQAGISGTARVAAAECDETSVKLTMEIITMKTITSEVIE